jgi:uncharacterized protein (TIGR03435 family)
MKTTTLLLIFFAGARCLVPAPQSQDAPPAFEAASVKLATEETMRGPGRRIQTSPGSLVTHGLSLHACILWAYNGPAQVIGPDWMDDVRLDIVAKAATPVGDKQLYLMLRTLLTERLGLRTHVEPREMPVYALTVAKGGPKFSESTTEGPLSAVMDKGVMVAQHASMTELATEMSGKFFDRPVVDATGLKGRYDIRLDIRALGGANPQDRMDMATAMMTALQQQLGLKVEGRKGTVDVLVIDHAEKVPTEN